LQEITVLVDVVEHSENATPVELLPVEQERKNQLTVSGRDAAHSGKDKNANHRERASATPPKIVVVRAPIILATRTNKSNPTANAQTSPGFCLKEIFKRARQKLCGNTIGAGNLFFSSAQESF
jgi:hypothetical protein